MSELSDQIIALAKKRVRPIEIAKQLGCRHTTVGTYLCTARRAGVKIPSFQRGPIASLDQAHVPLSGAVVRALISEADQRGITMIRLAERLIQACVEGDLINAVLDDEEGSS